MTGRRILGGALAIIALVLLLGRWGTGIYSDYLWYASLGAPELWRAKSMVTVLLVVASFAVATAFSLVNVWAVRQSIVQLVLPRRIANIEIGEEVPRRYLTTAVVTLSVIMGMLLTFPTDRWYDAVLAQAGKPFIETDPYFGADLGFYVYWLPFETALHYWAIVVLAAVTALVITLYALTPSLRWDRGALFVSTYVRRHFTMLGAAVMLVLAWSYRLGMYRALTFGGSAAGVFTSVDSRLIPFMLLLSVVTVGAAIVVAWAGWTGQMRLAFGAVTTVLVLSLISRSIVPLVMRRSVDPAAQEKTEAPFVGTRLTFTRRAYGVDRMHAEPLGSGFASAAEAAQRVAVWDGALLARAAERLPRMHVIGDHPAWQATATGMSAVLIQRGAEGNPDGPEIWSAGRYDPASADERGFPLLVPRGSYGADELVRGEPAVYDAAPAYSVLSDSGHQLTGVEMVSTGSRLMYAWSLQNFRLLFGDLPANRPVMVQRRSVRDRVSSLVPFLEQGSEVVPLISGDTLYWVLELYTTSDTYPLSQRFTLLGEERSYFQHAATALIHAASGHVTFIADPSPDPIASTWLTYFPRVFVPPGAIAPALRAMLPPITDAARAQALAFAAAGFRGDSLEVRHFASPDGADSSAAGREPARAVLPPFTGVSEIWPLLDSTERVRGVVASTSGATRSTSWLPVASDGKRWGAVVDLLRVADTTRRDGGLVRAPLRVVPVGAQALYVQPTFEWRPGANPTLFRVMAARGDSVRTGPTLARALGVSTDTGATAMLARPSARPRADSLYRAMRDALGKGDWAAFGRAFDALGGVLGMGKR
ncbi:hypothetical protein BH09GEM1_BH09GEM1_17490 [soil metagenome]